MYVQFTSCVQGVEQFKIVNPILSGTNKRLDSLCSDPADTSFILQQNGEGNPEEEEQQQERERANESDTNEFNDEEVEQKAPLDKTLLKRKINTKLHEKRNVPRSQLQALSQLATGVNKLAEAKAKRMKLEQEDRDVLLKFWREEAAKKLRP